MPAAFDIQPGQDFACPSDAHTRMGSDPHATFAQSQPAVNEEEPRSFANPCEAGAKKPSEAQFGKADAGPGTKNVLSIDGPAGVRRHITFDLSLKSNVSLKREPGMALFLYSVALS